MFRDRKRLRTTDVNYDLYFAVITNWVEMVARILKRVGEYDFKRITLARYNRDNLPLLIIALERGFVRIAYLLMAYHADVNVSSENKDAGWEKLKTPLLLALKIEMLDTLPKSWYPRATQEDFLRREGLVSILLEKGAKVDCFYQGGEEQLVHILLWSFSDRALAFMIIALHSGRISGRPSAKGERLFKSLVRYGLTRDKIDNSTLERTCDHQSLCLKKIYDKFFSIIQNESQIRRTALFLRLGYRSEYSLFKMLPKEILYQIAIQSSDFTIHNEAESTAIALKVAI